MNEKFIDEVMGLVDDYAETVEQSVRGGDFVSADLEAERGAYEAIRAKLGEVVREPLSEEEIFNIYCKSDSNINTTTTNLFLFTRAIEAAHNIGAK